MSEPARSGRVRHPRGFTLTLPAGTQILARDESRLEAALPAAGRPALAVADARPLVEVRVEAPVGRRGLEGWVDLSLVVQAQVLVGARLLDSQPTSVAGLAARHTLTQHLADGELSVTLEQWWVVAGDRGTVLSVSLASLDVATHAERVAALAGGLEPAVEPA